MKRSRENIEDSDRDYEDLTEKFKGCCTDDSDSICDGDEVDDLIDKLNMNNINDDENDDDVSINEYDELLDVCKKTNGTVDECMNIINVTITRYLRYLNAIVDWMEFDDIRDYIYIFFNMSSNTKEEIRNKLIYMRSIDKIFVVIADESRKGELDSDRVEIIRNKIDSCKIFKRFI